uniref:Capsid protein n=1 Tax=Cruciviridae sp. TaxID=1955495 RepID=A0A1S6LVE3_9VIRU|nr:capsid protein [Cruciviridae sp.]
MYPSAYGKGDYKVRSVVASKPRRPWNLGGIGAGLGTIAGAIFGGPGGAALGGSIGSQAGSLLGKITGLGDYKIKYNTLAKNSTKLLSGDSVPAVQNTHTGVRICHREYITDINSSVNFINSQYNINPGLSSTFPWLSGVAQNFQQYKLHGMIFTFVSTSADALNSTNTALGTVIMSTNYNASQAPFLNKSQMENNEFTTSSKPSNNIMHMIECDPKQTIQEGKFYIRTGSLPANQDIKTYDVGLFQLGTVGSQAVATVGELHVSYDIEFMKPIDLSLVGTQNKCAHYFANAGVTTSNYFGTAQVQRFDTIGITLSANTITFNPQFALPGDQFLLYIYWIGTAVSTVSPNFGPSNCSLVYDWGPSQSQSIVSAPNAASMTFVSTAFLISIASSASLTNPATITLSSGTLPTTAYMDLVISQMPPAYA